MRRPVASAGSNHAGGSDTPMAHRDLARPRLCGRRGRGGDDGDEEPDERDRDPTPRTLHGGLLTTPCDARICLRVFDRYRSSHTSCIREVVNRDARCVYSVPRHDQPEVSSRPKNLRQLGRQQERLERIPTSSPNLSTRRGARSGDDRENLPRVIRRFRSHPHRQTCYA